MLQNKIENVFKKIMQLPMMYTYLLFFAVSYISIYVPYIQGGKLFFGHDSDFHLSRIEALYTAIQNGDFFPKITYFLAEGMGYASSIFYSDIFLYPAAFLRLIGFPLGLSYVYYVLFLTFFTFVIAYYSFDSISHNKQKSLLFSLLYGLSSYRIADVVVRGALGEIVAFMVLPVAFVGIIQIVRGDEKKFYILSIGMASLFFSHILSTFIFGLFIVGYLLLNISILVRERQRIIYLVYATFLTIAMVASNLFPIIEQLSFQKLKVQSDQLFFLQRSAASLAHYIKSAFLNQEYNNVGWLIFVMLVLLLIRVRKLGTQNRQFLFLGSLFLFLATNHFPHYWLHDTLFNAIQFPWRYFIIVTLCFTWVFADSFSLLFSLKKYVQIVTAILIVMLLLVSVIQYQLKQVKNLKVEYSFCSKLNGFNLGAGKEYLPAEMEYESVLQEVTGVYPNSKEIKITEAKRVYSAKNTISFKYRTKKQTKITLPIVYYKGYSVQVTGPGEVSGVEKSKEFKGLCEITVSGEGKVKFWYKGTIVQKVTFVVSLVTWTCLVIYLWKRKNNDEFYNEKN